MARHFGKRPLPAGTVFNEAEIKAQAAAQNVVIGKGDVVLFHTGWLEVAEDADAFMAGEPGIGLGGAKYLAGLDVVAIGADTWGLEVVPGEDPNRRLPGSSRAVGQKRHLHSGEHERRRVGCG